MSEQADVTGERAAPPAGDGAALDRLRRIEGRLGEVRSALSRLDDGSYGQCVACGSEIDDGVLSADPVATLCDRCRNRQD